MEFVEFEWDPGKEAVNRSIHKVGFDTASHVFDDPAALQSDPYEENGELRYNAIGKVGRAVLVVSYTSDWADGVEWIRIISARGADKSQRIEYEQR